MSQQDRDALIVGHLDLVDRIARQVREKLPPCFELDDLIGSGRLGLIQAARSFNPARGVAFGAYARMRIKGEMLESVGLHGSAGLHDRATRRLSRRRRWDEATRPPIAEHDFRPAGEERRPTETSDPRVDLNNLVEMRKREDLVDRAIATLPPRHAILIEMHYRQDVAMCEIAGMREFRLSRGRTSQIHSEALDRLREYFLLRGKRAA